MDEEKGQEGGAGAKQGRGEQVVSWRNAVGDEDGGAGTESSWTAGRMAQRWGAWGVESVTGVNRGQAWRGFPKGVRVRCGRGVLSHTARSAGIGSNHFLLFSTNGSPIPGARQTCTETNSAATYRARSDRFTDPTPS